MICERVNVQGVDYEKIKPSDKLTFVCVFMRNPEQLKKEIKFDAHWDYDAFWETFRSNYLYYDLFFPMDEYEKNNYCHLIPILSFEVFGVADLGLDTLSIHLQDDLLYFDGGDKPNISKDFPYCFFTVTKFCDKVRYSEVLYEALKNYNAVKGAEINDD